MFLYLYDIKTDKKIYNKIKRRFYYSLKQSELSTLPLKTKSVILVPDNLEVKADLFFMRFRGYIEIYKAKVEYIQEIF